MTVVLGVGVLAALAEYLDVPGEDRGIARLDLSAALVAFLLYVASAFLRGFDVGGAAAGTAPFLIAIAGLIVTVVDAAVAANLYSGGSARADGSRCASTGREGAPRAANRAPQPTPRRASGSAFTLTRSSPIRPPELNAAARLGVDWMRGAMSGRHES